MVSKSTKISQLGRRGFIKTLTALGISGEVARSLSGDELKQLTDDPTDEVPIIERYQHTNHKLAINKDEPIRREPVYKTIPREQWIRINTAIDAVRRIKRKVRSADLKHQESNPRQVEVSITNRVDNSALGVAVKTTEYIDKNGKTVITGPDVTALKEVVPASTTGKVNFDNRMETRKNIPIIIEKSRVEEQAFESDYRPVPGGCQQERESDDKINTTGTPAQDNLNNDKPERVMITCAHCLDRKTSHNMAQSSSGSIYGESGRSMPRDIGDVGVVQPTSADVTWNIAGNSGGYDWQINGIITDSAIQSMIDSGRDVVFQGQNTGRDKEATLTDYTPDSTSEHGSHVVVDHDSEGGDSGAPYFHLIAGDAYIVGIHHAAAGSNATKAQGNTAEWMENELNVTV